MKKIESLFDRTRFAQVMFNAENTLDEDQDECDNCGEHPLDCECEEELA